MPDIKTLTYQPHCGRTDHDCGSYLSPASVTDQAHAMNHAQEVGTLVVNLDSYTMGRIDKANNTLICPWYLNPHHTHFLIAWEYRLPQFITLPFTYGRSVYLTIKFGNRNIVIDEIAQITADATSFQALGGVLSANTFNVGFSWRSDTLEGSIPATQFPGSGQNIQNTLIFDQKYQGPVAAGFPSPVAATRPETGQVITEGGIFSVKMWTYRQ